MQRSLGRLVLLQRVEVLQKKEPRRLLGVVKLAGRTRVLAQDVVNILECLLEQSYPRPSSLAAPLASWLGAVRGA